MCCSYLKLERHHLQWPADWDVLCPCLWHPLFQGHGSLFQGVLMFGRVKDFFKFSVAWSSTPSACSAATCIFWCKVICGSLLFFYKIYIFSQVCFFSNCLSWQLCLWRALGLSYFFKGFFCDICGLAFFQRLKLLTFFQRFTFRNSIQSLLL